MKKYLLTSLLMLLPFCGWAADEPAKPKQGYAELSADGKTLTFKYGEKPEGAFDVADTGNDRPGWHSKLSNVTRILFDHTFKNQSPQSMYYWFQGASWLTTVDSLVNLNTSSVKNMGWAFSGCTKLEGIDLSGMSLSSVTTTQSMFSGCTSLKTILVDNNWNTNSVTTSTDMFKDCNALTGEDGSKIGTGATDKTRANTADGGLLTKKTVTLSTVYTSDDTDGKYWASYYNAHVNVALPENTKVWLPKVTDDAKRETTKIEVTEVKIVPAKQPVILSSASTITLTRTFEAGNGRYTSYERWYGVHKFEKMPPYAYKIDNVSGKLGFTKCTGTTLTDQRAYLTIYDAPEAYASLTGEENNLTLTFYYDGKKALEERGTWTLLKPFATASQVGWGSRASEIKNVVFDSSMKNTYAVVEGDKGKNAITSTAYWFYGCSNLATITDIENLKTLMVTDMKYMFYGCNSLTSLTLRTFKTDSVTNMSNMFNGCSKVTSVSLGFNTQNVTDMSHMFSNCSAKDSWTIAAFDTKKVKDMSYMFAGCANATSITLPTAETPLEKMEGMFSGCSSLINVTNLAKLNTESVTSMANLFSSCTKLRTIDGTIDGTIDISGLEVNKVTTMKEMFANCKALTNVEWPADTAKVLKDMQYMFANCTKLSSFVSPKKLKEGSTTEYTPKFYTPAVENLKSMFSNCTSLTTLDLSMLHTEKVKDMSYLLSNCTALTNLKMPLSESKSLTDMSYLMYNCEALTSTDSLRFTSTALSNMSYAFSGCKALTKVILEKLNTDNVTSMEQLFNGCTALKEVDLTNFTKARATSLEKFFNGCEALTDPKMKGFNTSQVTSLKEMFSGCKVLEKVDLSSFNTSRVTDMSLMFKDCVALTTINAGTGWTTAAVTDGSNMFLNAKKVMGNKRTTYDASHIDHAYARIDGGKDAPGYFSDENPIIYPQVFALLSANKDELTFKYDEKPKTGNVYALPKVDEEIGWGSSISSIRRVIIDSSFAEAPTDSLPETTAQWFSQAINLESITGLEYLNTSKVEKMDSMFFNCNKLQSINLMGFNTENVESMSYMFRGCTNVKELDLSKFNTENVTTMQDMFARCTNLTELDLTSFETSAVTNMSYMMAECTHLQELTLSNKFVTNAGTENKNMFEACEYLKRVTFTNGLPTSSKEDIFKGVGKMTAPVVIKVPQNTIPAPSPIISGDLEDLENPWTEKENSKGTWLRTLTPNLDKAMYNLTFKAKATTERGNIHFQYQNVTGTTTTHQGGYKSFNVGSEEKDFSYEFVNNDYTDINTLQLILDAAGGTYTVTNITLTKSFVEYKGGFFRLTDFDPVTEKKQVLSDSISHAASSSDWGGFIQQLANSQTLMKTNTTAVVESLMGHPSGKDGKEERWAKLIDVATELNDSLKTAVIPDIARTSLMTDMEKVTKELASLREGIVGVYEKILADTTAISANIASYRQELKTLQANIDNATALGSLDGVEAALFGVASSTLPSLQDKIRQVKVDVIAKTDIKQTMLKEKLANLEERLVAVEKTLPELQARLDNARVDKTQVTITVQSVQRMYGEENPVFDYRVTGGTITGTPVISCAATKTSAAGTYPITLSAGTLVMDNVVLVNGTLTVTKAPLTVTTSDATIKAGDSMPTFTLSYSGFRNGDTESSLTSRPVARCETSSTQTPGRYTVTISGGQSQNYEFTYVSAQLTIEGTQPEGTPFKASDNAMYKATSTQTVTLLYPPEEKKAEYEITPTITYDGKTYTVNVIDAYAFTGNKILEKITIPATITAIGERAFSGCSNLKEITCLSPTPIGYDPNLARTLSQTRAASDGYIFRGVDKQTCILFVPVGCVEVYRNAPVWGEFVNIREIGSTAIIGVEAADGTDSGAWYDLRGRRLSSEPTEKGIYIHNGRKVVKR
jgi:surface protein